MRRSRPPRQAAEEIKQRLRGYAGVYEVTDSFRAGKQEMKLGIKPAAETVGLTLESLGRQVRQAIYGEEAQSIQRGRDDVRVMVRYPRDERRSLGDLENMRIRTPDGGQVPFSQVAVVEPGRGFASIRRVDGNRAVNVTAAIDPSVTSAGDIIADLNARILPEVLARHPGVFHTFEGAMAEQRDALGGLQRGFTLALLMIFALLAVPLKSYVQPLIIMSAIPFGLVGAVWGHVFLGLDVSIMSMFGLVALTGVVVNDSLIMVDFINRARAVHSDVGRMARQAGARPADRWTFETAGLALAVREAGVHRFRPIVLTSLTTFFGLAPLMWNESLDAAFMVPMAVSLGFGVLFATLVTLVLVPTMYMILDDIGRAVRGIFAFRAVPRSDDTAACEVSGLRGLCIGGRSRACAASVRVRGGFRSVMAWSTLGFPIACLMAIYLLTRQELNESMSSRAREFLEARHVQQASRPAARFACDRSPSGGPRVGGMDAMRRTSPPPAR